MRSHHYQAYVVGPDFSEPLVTPGDPRWEDFLERLTGPDGLDVRNGRWNCSAQTDRPHTRRALLAVGLSPAALPANLAYFERRDGYCDCEVWMNVEARDLDVSREEES